MINPGRKLGLLLVAALCALGCAAAVTQAAKHGAYTTKGAYSYVSAPNLHPPKLSPDKRASFSKLAPGYFFLGNMKNTGVKTPIVGQPGALMLDRHLNPVWFQPVPSNDLAANLKLQTYAGKPALSYWQGRISNTGVSLSGEVVVVDQHYHVIGRVTGQDGWTISLHDAQVQGDTIWVTAYKDMPNQNLKPYRGPSSGTLYDAAVQQYELTGPNPGKLLQTWDARQHVPLSDSHQPVLSHTPWDAYHVNSLELLDHGNEILVSLRNTWAAYLINLQNGSIVWTLGGKHSSFKLPSKASFEWQHDVELHPNNVVSVFDDECCAVKKSGFGKFREPARGLVLRLDFTNHTGKELAQYGHNGDVVAFLGNTDLLSGGRVSIGWGSLPYFSEFSHTGKELLDVKWPGPNESYRSFVEKWIGTPYYPPSGAARTASGKATVYASWNGATQVVRWRVLAGTSASHLKTVATVARRGFETTIGLKRSYKLYEVVALDSKGHALGHTKAFKAK